ncbi:MAG: sulfur oxidation c-type cytochrome SoxA [Hyphomicrobiales bacterium]|nr:sulfur oxidation c-type cytochrome SoxA [Hyphomicrobiales bacterium]
MAVVGGICIAGYIAATLPVEAQDSKPLTIEGTTLTSRVKVGDDNPLAPELISGWHYRTSETQALETDDFQNPAFLWVEKGEELWSTVDGSEGKSCQSCHGEASDSMKGVRASMPKWSEAAGKPQTLEQHINSCRKDRMGAEEWKWEADQMLSMTAYVGLQSRGMPVDVQTDGPMASWVDRGKEIYYQRSGQLDLSCASCHEQNNGKFIRADFLSQGHINGFPTYRLKWQKPGSIHRRFKGCMNDVRAEAYDVASDEFIALELYVASRGEGLAVETPAVRQ